jgi:isocitrate/isopropylmalate dehydrogenase
MSLTTISSGDILSDEIAGLDGGLGIGGRGKTSGRRGNL